MIYYNQETEKANKIINENANISTAEFLENEIEIFLNSKSRKDMITAYNYLNGKHEILQRKRGLWTDEGFVESVFLPNNKIVDNQYAKVVEQKTNYLFARELTIECDNKEFEEKIKNIFNKRFIKMFKQIGENAINYGIGWLYIYLENGQIQFKNFKPYEILPFWADEEEIILDMAVRVYTIEAYQNKQIKEINKVEVYFKDKVEYYTYDNKLIFEKVEKYITLQDYEKTIIFNNLPLIPFKSGNKQQPLINSVKSLQDALNTIKSNWVNVTEEDQRTALLVLKGYGTDAKELETFRHNLAQYNIVSLPDEDGSLDIMQVPVESSNYTTIINMLKKSIIENANAFDVKDERLSNNPNQMNIRSMYSDIDLASNGLEVEFQCSLEILFEFCSLFFYILEGKDFSKEKVNVTFNKDQLLNASEIIQDLANSYEMLSRETLLSKHPYVKDVEVELNRLQEQEQQMYSDVYPNHEVMSNEE